MTTDIEASLKVMIDVARRQRAEARDYAKRYGSDQTHQRGMAAGMMIAVRTIRRMTSGKPRSVAYDRRLGIKPIAR